MRKSPYPTMGSRSPFRSLPRGQEVSDIFGHQTTRVTLGRILKRGDADDLWDLILECIDLGFCRKNTLCSRIFRANFLFQGSKALYEIDLGWKGQRDYIRDIILPIAKACREEILAHPDQFDDIIRRGQREKVFLGQKNDLNGMAQTLPDGEVVVKAYGAMLWPTLDGSYTYDQLCTACWYFRNMGNMLFGGVHDTALSIRQSIKWFSEYANHREPNPKMAKVFQIIRHLTLLWESEPTGECAWPPFPLQEGKW